MLARRRQGNWKRRPRQGALVILGVCLLGMLSLPLARAQNSGAVSEQVELVYDDGVPDLSLTFLENAGTVFAVRFTPPAGTVQLLEVRYFVPDTSKGACFNLEVTGLADEEPGETLLGPVHVRAGALGWNGVQLGDSNLYLEGDFFVLLNYDGEARLTLGAEDRPPLSGRTYDTDC